MDFGRLHIDKSLFYALVTLSIVSLLVSYSASGEDLAETLRHATRLLLGFGLMIAVAQVRPETLRSISPYLFGAGMVLLLAVLGFGIVSKGARRWLNFGLFTFQPAELMKLALPMALAWFYAKQPVPPRAPHLIVGAAAILIPAVLIAKQPDLGTALLIVGSGFAVLFLAGMSWQIITGLFLMLAAAVPVAWTYMHDYQRQRILTLFNPESDPLGTGYHTLQSMIAIGSGGVLGKGWLNGTQAQLKFLPESSTDFVFAVFAEEFGLVGEVLLVSLYLFIVARCLMIAFHAQDTYTRLLAGGFGVIIFFYVFINIGMVSGILPVVGVPLPLMSYGGTSTVTLMTAFGILMSIQTHRKLAGA